MKILFIIPGSGDSFYCGNCFRDNLQATALRKAGHDVIIMPLYLPLKQPSFQGNTPLFFPAPTYYAAQKFFRKTRMPRWIQRITGSNKMLDLASSLSGATSAEGMEDMTLSMITGNAPAFTEHVTPMINWIRDGEKPDIIHLSSTLLAGIAKTLRQNLDIPIICSVQDEEVWIESLNKVHADTAWQAIADNIRYISHFVTASKFYGKIAKERIPRISKLDVIYPAVDKKKYASSIYPESPVIGFFYRMNRANGLDILAEAFVELKKRNTIPCLKLKIGGGYTGKDKNFMKEIRKTLSPYPNDVEISECYSLEEHAAFFRSITVISVPLTFEEGVGLYLCEAFAAGRPAVVPATGSFPEIAGNAGILYQPNNSKALADALETILIDKERYSRMVEEAKNLSLTRYNQNVMSKKLESIYKQYITT